jgi:hypothetical protein
MPKARGGRAKAVFVDGVRYSSPAEAISLVPIEGGKTSSLSSMLSSGHMYYKGHQVARAEAVEAVVASWREIVLVGRPEKSNPTVFGPSQNRRGLLGFGYTTHRLGIYKEQRV